ncbi:MAG: hypothetical protein Q8O28_12310 [Smithellaceae bacterium]|nr:hypothetical protein [Smithellaceae bacterium]
MTSNELIEEIRIELENIEVVLKELACLYGDVKESEVSLRNKTAAAAFLAQFYGGIENILKRISRFYEMNLPSSELWHVELFKRFCDPPLDPLPIIFDKALSQDLAPFRKFRHVVHHGYGFQLDWDRMKEGIEKSQAAFARFKMSIENYITKVK